MEKIPGQELDEIFLFDGQGKAKHKSKYYSKLYNQEESDRKTQTNRCNSQTKGTQEGQRGTRVKAMKKRFQSVEDLLVRIKGSREGRDRQKGEFKGYWKILRDNDIRNMGI